MTDHPFINGWAVPLPGSHLLHALPYPLDLGGSGEAICGKRDVGPKGWIEFDKEANGYWYRCSTCVNKFRNMYIDDDGRLNAEDRRNYERLEEEYNVSRGGI
jgi:hypothetical protein